MNVSIVSEFDGPDSVVEAAESLIDKPRPIVVRNLLSTEGTDDLFKLGRNRVLNKRIDPYNDKGTYSPERVQDLLYSEVPLLSDVDAIIAQWWSERGYTDYELARPHFGSDEKSPHTLSTVEMHVDTKIKVSHGKKKRNKQEEVAQVEVGSDTLYGPITLDVCSRGRGVLFYARCPDIQLSDDETGRFSIEKFIEVVRNAKKQRALSYKLGTKALTPLVLYPGDGVLFPQHPTTTEHALGSVTPVLDVISPAVRRMTHIFEHELRKIVVPQTPKEAE